MFGISNLLSLKGLQRGNTADDLVDQLTKDLPYRSPRVDAPIDEDRYAKIAQKAASLDDNDREAGEYLGQTGPKNFELFQNQIRHEFDHEISHVCREIFPRLSEASALRGKIREDIDKVVADARNWKDKIDESPLVSEATAKIRTVKDTLSQEARHETVVLDEATAEYSNFVRNHPVSGNANYDPNWLVRAAWIVAVIVCETLVNAYFFINSTDRGILGSLFEVIFFAPMNVAAAVVIGLFSLRYARHKLLSLKIFGAVSGVILIGFILMFNLYLAAVRISLEEGVTLSSFQVLSRITSGSFEGLLDSQAVSVFLAGVVLACFACVKAYKLFDPYPGFTRVCVNRTQARDCINSLASDAKTQISSIAHTQKDEAGDLYDHCLDSVSLHRKLLEVSRADRQSQTEQVQRLTEQFASAVEIFRATYVANLYGVEGDLPYPKPLSKPTKKFDKTISLDARKDKELGSALSEIEKYCQRLVQDIQRVEAAAREDVPNIIRDAHFQSRNNVVGLPKVVSPNAEPSILSAENGAGV